MTQEQDVYLKDGTFHGDIISAPLPPRALSLGVHDREKDERWVESYIYTDEVQDGLPVMRFFGRRRED